MLEFVSFVIVIIFGILSKRNPKINNYLIPLQNLSIGFVIAVINWIITKDFNTSVVVSGLLAGGTYDVFHNLSLIIKEKSKANSNEI